MNLPVNFPSQTEVIDEEVARFRALTPDARRASIRGMLNTGAALMRRSPRADFLQVYTLQQEEAARTAVREFVARHGG